MLAGLLRERSRRSVQGEGRVHTAILQDTADQRTRSNSRTLWAVTFPDKQLAKHWSGLEQVVLKNTVGFAAPAYALSPRMRRASWMSLGMIVTRLA